MMKGNRPEGKEAFGRVKLKHFLEGLGFSQEISEVKQKMIFVA